MIRWCDEHLIPGWRWVLLFYLLCCSVGALGALAMMLCLVGG